MKNARHRGLKNSLALQLWAVLMALGLSFGASAQSVSSADAAIAVAEQWLALADADQGGAMWDQSFPFMKEKIDRASWINHVTAKTNTLGQKTAPRVWAGMEHDINKPGLPPGEFASVLFMAPFSKTRGWEKVAVYWDRDRWVPVGYVFGAVQGASAPAAR
jgi:hypothetical protein